MFDLSNFPHISIILSDSLQIYLFNITSEWIIALFTKNCANTKDTLLQLTTRLSFFKKCIEMILKCTIKSYKILRLIFQRDIQEYLEASKTLLNHETTHTHTHTHTHRTRHAGHCWRSRDELIRDVLLWTPTHGRAKAGRPARTYIQQLCEDTGCCPEDLPRAMNDREEWRERVRDIRATSAIWWWWWWWYIYTSLSARLELDDIYIYIYNVVYRQRSII